MDQKHSAVVEFSKGQIDRIFPRLVLRTLYVYLLFGIFHIPVLIHEGRTPPLPNRDAHKFNAICFYRYLSRCKIDYFLIQKALLLFLPGFFPRPFFSYCFMQFLTYSSYLLHDAFYSIALKRSVRWEMPNSKVIFSLKWPKTGEIYLKIFNFILHLSLIGYFFQNVSSCLKTLRNYCTGQPKPMLS